MDEITNLDDPVSHPKMDVLYYSTLDDSQHACKSSKSGCLYHPNLNVFLCHPKLMFCAMHFVLVNLYT